MTDADVCVIGSGAGGGPVAWAVAAAGYNVVVLEKGPWLRDADFAKDEIALRRRAYRPNPRDEFHVHEDRGPDGEWTARASRDSGRNFWNGSLVGGATNLMNGLFYRMKPVDFRLLSEFGPIEGANTVDFPIDYDALEPFYTQIEHLVGVSGRVRPHPQQEPRSTADYPYPPTLEHPISAWIDRSCRALGLHAFPVARAILPYPALGRNGCAHSAYCAGYGCETGAKGSTRAALLEPAVASGRCEIRPNCHVHRLQSDARGNVIAAHYFDADGVNSSVSAKIFVVACQPIESARLLLLSTGPRHPSGLGNSYGQVGKNLLFSARGFGTGWLTYAGRSAEDAAALAVRGPFVNRALQDWYVHDDPETGARRKGGTVSFLFEPDNAIARADAQKWDDDGRLVWGSALKRRIHDHFTAGRQLRIDVLADWLPTDDCHVTLDSNSRDHRGIPVARVRLGIHPRNLEIARFLSAQGARVLAQLGAERITWSAPAEPAPNLVAGGCRFGTDPRTSVLDRDCRVHDTDNLYVSDGSFMPTGGSVPYTWTIYANALRVGESIVERLGGRSCADATAPTRAQAGALVALRSPATQSLKERPACFAPPRDGAPGFRDRPVDRTASSCLPAFLIL